MYFNTSTQKGIFKINNKIINNNLGYIHAERTAARRAKEEF